MDISLYMAEYCRRKIQRREDTDARNQKNQQPSALLQPACGGQHCLPAEAAPQAAGQACGSNT